MTKFNADTNSMLKILYNLTSHEVYFQARYTLKFFDFCSNASLAQPAERTAVNREVTGSIPVRSAFYSYSFPFIMLHPSPLFIPDLFMHTILMKSGSVDDLMFSWNQSLDEVNIEIPVSNDTTKGDVCVQFGCKCLKIRVCDVSIDELLADPVIADESLWYLEDLPSPSPKRILRIVLAKAHPGSTWSKVFVHQSGDLSQAEEQEARKSILLERFSNENPDFDFSQAQFNGDCTADARSFIGGLTL